MPSTLKRRSELYSPWPALRGAASRRESTTAAIADTAKIMSSTRASPSTASAPEMIDAGWFSRVASMTIEATSAAIVTSGTTVVRATGPSRPMISTTSAPTPRMTNGMNAAQSIWGPLSWAAARMSVLMEPGPPCGRSTDAWAICWACAGATAALTVGPERRSPNWG